MTRWSWGQDADGSPVTRTTEGTPLPSVLRGPSRRCLGCHDGTTALGEVANAGGGAAGRILGLESIAGRTDSTGRLFETIGNRDGELGGNHPVSVPYAGQSYNGIVSRATADGAIGGYYPAGAAGCADEGGGCTNAPRSDGRDGAAIFLVPAGEGDGGGLGVECTSCHEPHNAPGSVYFLRVAVDRASGLCRSCHNK